MKSLKTVLLAIFLFASCVARAQQSPPPAEDELFPSDEALGRAMAALCSPQAGGARIAAESRRLGQPLDTVLGSLPIPPDPLKARIVQGMRTTIEDAYRFPQIGEFTLFFFRTEVCFREVVQLRPYPRIDASVAALEKCEADNGKEPKEPLLRCVRDVVTRIVP